MESSCGKLLWKALTANFEAANPRSTFIPIQVAIFMRAAAMAALTAAGAVPPK